MFLSQRPNNDPEPWFGKRPIAHRVSALPLRETYDTYSWSPRHEEFDTPVNPILAAARIYVADYGPDVTLFAYIEMVITEHWHTYTLDEIQHARRVLTLLATLSN